MLKSIQHRATASPCADVRKCDVSRSRQRLTELMQKLCFGTIYILPVLNGEPVLDPLPRTVRRQKVGALRHSRPQGDFTLKRELVEFFDELTAIGNGIILMIEVAHGLPTVYEFEETIPV